MSWNLNAYYACISLAGVPDTAALNTHLKSFGASILPVLLADEDHDLWCAFDFIREEVEEAADEADALEALVNQIQHYLKDVSFQDGGVSLVVASEDETDSYYPDLVEALATFLLPYATTPYLLLRSAAFDKGGGYAHQFLLYRSGGEVVRECVTDVIERLCSNPTAPAGTLLPFTTVTAPEQVLVPVPA